MTEKEELSIYEAKNRALANNAVDLIKNHPSLTNDAIAAELQISRTTLWNIIKGEYAQELLRRELHEVETSLWQSIHQLENQDKPNPANIRFAAKLKADIARNIADKIRPTKTQNTNININIDLTQLQQNEQLHLETLARLPPNIRNIYLQKEQQIRQDWNIPPKP